MNNFFEAYTDGSCDNMNIYKAGGSAYVVLSDGILIEEGSKGFLGTTNYKRICSDYGISSKRDEQDNYHSVNTRRYGRL